MLSDFPLLHHTPINALSLKLVPAHTDDLRSCPSSDLLIQSGWASHDNLRGLLSPSLSHFLAVRLAYRNTGLYLHTLPRELPRQPNRVSKERVRNEDKKSLICKQRMTKELKLAVPRFQKNLFSLFSRFLYRKSLLPGRVIHNSHSFLSVEAPAAGEIPLECN